MRRVKETVPLEVCKQRALDYIKQNGRSRPSLVGYAIWPGVTFHSQGAAAAASRILKRMEKDGTIRWSSDRSNWGWVVV